MIEVLEVLRRTKIDDGITRPFFCGASDGNNYYLKGVGIGRADCIKEFVCGELGREFGLPIAPFEVVNVSALIMNHSLMSDISELGEGPAFASRHQPGNWFKYSDIPKIPQEIRRKVLVFDYWIRNEDRTLTEKGGNPNLIVDDRGELVVIDHNNAFDANFDRSSFLNLHVFGAEWDNIAGDLIARQEYRDELCRLLGKWADIVDSIPDEWLSDEHTGGGTAFNLSPFRNILDLASIEEFWDE